MVNGNRLMPSRDNNRSLFVVKLTTTDPTPFTRPFPYKPHERVLSNRQVMVEAAFTVMRWWRQQGMPKSGKVLGVVRGVGGLPGRRPGVRSDRRHRGEWERLSPGILRAR